MIQPLKLQATADSVTVDFFTNRTWHLLVIDPSRPKTVADWLMRSKLWVYWPNFTVQVGARGGIRRSKEVSVLHGYLPLAVTPSRTDTWDVVHRTPGTRGFLRDAFGHPSIIPEEDIEAIREIEGRLNCAPQQASESAFPIGSIVRMLSPSVWEGRNATVLEVAHDGRIRVEVSLWGRAASMWVDATLIETM